MSSFDTDLWDRDDFYRNDAGDVEADYTNHTLPPVNEGEYDFEESAEIEDLLDEEESSVIDNARIRLEQGRLYEMLIKHNLFENVDAMPQAVAKVQSEIKEFIIERLEVLLGMKSENQPKETHIIKESQFNDMEIQALKMIASKVTKGASEVQSEKKELSGGLNTIKTLDVKKNTLNSVKSSESIQKKPVQATKPAKAPVKQSSPSASKAAPRNNPEAIVSSKTLSPEDIAKRDMKYIESLKEMSLADANKVVSQRHTRPKPSVTLNQEDINRNYATKMAVNETAQTFTTLLQLSKKVK